MTSRSRNAYRAALVVAAVASVALVWLSLGVGIIGKDGDPANAMYLAVVAAGIACSIAGRFRARAMSLALTAMALGQALVAAITLAIGLDFHGAARPR